MPMIAFANGSAEFFDKALLSLMRLISRRRFY